MISDERRPNNLENMLGQETRIVTKRRQISASRTRGCSERENDCKKYEKGRQKFLCHCGGLRKNFAPWARRGSRRPMIIGNVIGLNRHV